MVRAAVTHGCAAVFAALVVLLLTGCAPQATGGGDDPGQSAPPASPDLPGPVDRYVALGDSYTSAPLVPVTDVANGCFRSTGNYPALVARVLGAHLVDRSCGGATTAHLWRRQFPAVPPQLSAVTPGTDLVTLGIGGNDGGVFGRMLSACTRAGSGAASPSGSSTPCRDRMATADGGDLLLDAVAAGRDDVVRAVRAIERRAPRAEVLLVGYPRLLTAGRTCPELPLAAGDYAYVERVNRGLNDNLRYAARRTGASYVDVWAASRRHDICSDQPWVNGSRTDRQRAAAFHPFAMEQEAVAQLVVRALRQASAP